MIISSNGPKRGKPWFGYCTVIEEYVRLRRCRGGEHWDCERVREFALFALGKGKRRAHRLPKWNPLVVSDGGSNHKVVEIFRTKVDGTIDRRYNRRVEVA